MNLLLFLFLRKNRPLSTKLENELIEKKILRNYRSRRNGKNEHMGK